MHVAIAVFVLILKIGVCMHGCKAVCIMLNVQHLLLLQITQHFFIFLYFKFFLDFLIFKFFDF